MIDQPRIGYHQLSVGFEFPPQSYKLDTGMVSDYLRAVGETSELYQREGLVPPLAITAFAMAALSEGLTLPSGTIHVTQELEFIATVRVGDTITCASKVSRKVDRAGMHIMSTDINVWNQKQEKVLTGRVGFVLPEPGGADKP
jgi:acyl dehydratase